SESEVHTKICNAELPYMWNGMTMTAGGVYEFVTENSVGCDSIVTLYLDLEEVARDTLRLSGCSGVEFQGETYNSSTQLHKTYTSVDKCDSLIQLVIIAIQPIELWFPNAFSPNGDGLND